MSYESLSLSCLWALILQIKLEFSYSAPLDTFEPLGAFSVPDSVHGVFDLRTVGAAAGLVKTVAATTLDVVALAAA